MFSASRCNPIFGHNGIRIVNPRCRNQRIFEKIVESIRDLGLKKPIQVSPRAPVNGDNYIMMNGRAPAEADMQRFFGTTPPTVHQMIVKLEEKGLISRTPGQARSIELLVAPEKIPRLLPPDRQ